MRQARIVVVGAVAVDVKAQSFGELVRRADVPGQAHVMVGGVGRNLAKNLALLGASATIISAIGDDEFGRMISADLGRAGVNINHLAMNPGRGSATWVGILDADGDLEVGVFSGAILDTLTPEAMRERAAIIIDADLVTVDATLPRATIDAIVALAKINRVPLYLNPASVARAQTVIDGIGDFAIVTANTLEAEW